MKNLFTYKNNIASGLKRYGKFLLLAISLLFLSNTAWAAAPVGLYMKCNTTTDVEDYSSTDFEWKNMNKVEAGKWEITVTLENQKNNFFVGTNKTASGLFTTNVSFEAKDNSSCVTTVDKDKDYGGKRRIYIGKDDNASCEVTFIITYISDTQYKLEIVDVNPVVPCEDKEPTVTTGTMTVDAYNFFVVNDNNLIDLGTNCDVAIAYQSKGVEITTNKEGSKDRYTTVTSGATGSTLGVYTITATGVQPQNNTTYWYRAYAINNTSAGIGNDGVGYGEWKSFNLSIPGTTPSIRIGKQPVVSNLTDVAMNFQIADWGCTDVTVVKVYYTTDGTEPTTTSSVWEFNLTPAITNNTNFNLEKTGLSSGNYNIKAVACNASGCGDLSDMASFSIYCEQPDQPALSATNGTICSGANITLQITNYASELTYKVVKGTEDTDVAIDNDGNFTLTQGGTYVVKVKNDCSDFVSSSNIVITENEKPEAPTFYNSNRASCTLQNVSFKIAEGNNVIITMNEGTSTTAPAPVDGNVYEGTTVPATIANDLANVEDLAVDPTKDYTLTCYQYNAASLCYSEPVTFYIPKNLAIITEVEVSNVTRITADVTVTANAGPVLGTAVAELYLEWRVKGSGDAWTGGSPNIVANPVYQITMLTEGTTYEVRAKAKNNSGCDGNGFGYSEIEEFTTKTCPVLTPQTVTGVNTIGKVQATITMASSETNAEYQLYIEDTPIDGTLQDGTGSALTWQVNQTGLYYVKGWFKEAPYYCTNAPTIMGEYNLDCVQAATPIISIDKNVICSNDAVGATISVNQVDGVSYKLYKNGEEQNNSLTDGKFAGLTAAGNYTVVATENKCQTTATSQIVTLTVIDASASVTINPTTDTTTPWVPVNFTVTSTAGAPYTLVYKDAAGNDVTDQMVVVKKGNSYSLKIPRPSTWAKGNSTDPVATTTYTVEASLEGQASCGSTSTLTITLNDTFEICE